MQAIVYSEFGSPDVLQLAEIDKPVPKDGEVLVEVRAAAANPLDWHFIRGEPPVMRLMGTPNRRTPGVDFAGQVEQIGANVAQFRVGDEVFGSGRGAFAEYACASAENVARKPKALTFEQAAAIPVAGCTALLAVRDHGRLQPGQSVLINGAAGGVGTFAVQIAKALGATVTGVCSATNAELVRSLGADHVIDYTAEDFARNGRRYDLVLHVAGNRSLKDHRRVLAPDGTLVLVGGGVGRDWGDSATLDMLGTLAFVIGRGVFSRFLRQHIRMFVGKTRASDLAFLAGLCEAGKLTPVIARIRWRPPPKRFATSRPDTFEARSSSSRSNAQKDSAHARRRCWRPARAGRTPIQLSDRSCRCFLRSYLAGPFSWPSICALSFVMLFVMKQSPFYLYIVRSSRAQTLGGGVRPALAATRSQRLLFSAMNGHRKDNEAHCIRLEATSA